jgi:GNAT superfamily N-acetyltransferase
VPTVSVTRTYLELKTPAQLREAGPPPETARVVPVSNCPPSQFRWLYATVGGPWHWRDRLGWDDATITRHFAQASVYLRVLEFEGEPAGYYELNRLGDGAIEVIHIGLVPGYIGRGLGGFLVSEAARDAWALGATRVCLNTCTLDGPSALPNYLRRGFTTCGSEEYFVELPPG